MQKAARLASVPATPGDSETTLAGRMGSLGGIARTGVDLTARNEIVRSAHETSVGARGTNSTRPPWDTPRRSDIPMDP
eukprot:2484499-Prymnesium_polylepis.1